MIYDRDNRPEDHEDDNELWDDELLLDDSYEAPEQSSGAYTPYSPHDYEHTDYYEPSGDSEYSGQSEYQDTSKPSVHSGDPEDSDRNGDEEYYSDPEPEKKIKKKGFFRKDDEEGDNDFYDSDVEPTPVVKKPKVPKLDPEDPDYWIEEESPLSRIISGSRNKWKWWLAGTITILVIILGVWLWFFRPYIDNAVKYGYIRSMERRGSVLKTFEGVMIPYKELGDPNPLYFEKINFSVESDSLAARMKWMMLNCIPVRVEYEQYHSPLPWKGEANIIVVKADSADISKILPPEYRK